MPADPEWLRRAQASASAALGPLLPPGPLEAAEVERLRQGLVAVLEAAAGDEAGGCEVEVVEAGPDAVTVRVTVPAWLVEPEVGGG